MVKARVPRRGRPTAEQTAIIDEAILAAAQQLFLTEGYADTSMEAVALSSGVSKPTLYARYPAKADLFEAIVQDRLAAWAESDASVISAEMPIDDWLRMIAVRHLEGMRRPEIRAFDRLIMAEAGRFPELARSFHEQGYRGAVRRVADRLAAAGRGDGMPAQNPDLVALLFVSGLIGWFRMETTLRDVSSEECWLMGVQLANLTLQGRQSW